VDNKAITEDFSKIVTALGNGDLKAADAANLDINSQLKERNEAQDKNKIYGSIKSDLEKQFPQ
jgi:hypothetical protein